MQVVHTLCSSSQICCSGKYRNRHPQPPALLRNQAPLKVSGGAENWAQQVRRVLRHTVQLARADNSCLASVMRQNHTSGGFLGVFCKSKGYDAHSFSDGHISSSGRRRWCGVYIPPRLGLWTCGHDTSCLASLS